MLNPMDFVTEILVTAAVLVALIFLWQRSVACFERLEFDCQVIQPYSACVYFLLFQHDLDFLMSPARTLDRYRGRVMKVLTGDDKLHGSVLDGIWCCCFQCCHRPSDSLDSSAGLARFQDIPGFCNRLTPVLPRWPRWSLYW